MTAAVPPVSAGLHHVTTIASLARRTFDFHAGVLDQAPAALLFGPEPHGMTLDELGHAGVQALRRIEQEWYAVADALEPGSGADRRDKERARKMLTESILASEPLFGTHTATTVRVRNGEISNPSPPEVGRRMAKLWDAVRKSAALGGQMVEVG